MINIEGFTNEFSLNIKIGYYNIKIPPGVKTLCTIVLSWGYYECQKLRMGFFNSPDIFDKKISDILKGFDTVYVYIDNILVIKKETLREI